MTHVSEKPCEGSHYTLCRTQYELRKPYKETTLTAENRLVNKHCESVNRLVNKLTSLTTSDCLLIARLWSSPALFCCNGKRGLASIPAIATVELRQSLRASPYPGGRSLWAVTKCKSVSIAQSMKLKIELHSI